MCCKLLVLLFFAQSAFASEGLLWHSLRLSSGMSIPSRMDPSKTASDLKDYQGCSLVRVKEVSRTITRYRNERDIQGVMSKVPANAQLECQIQEVFTGDTSLLSKKAYATVQTLRIGSLTRQLLLSEFLPDAKEEGIWLVKLVDGRLRCISLIAMNVRFPVYASGAPYQSSSNGKVYKDILELMQKIKQITDEGIATRKQWIQLSNSKNKYIAQWAVWELSHRHKEDAIDDLIRICGNPNKHPVTQAFADNTLLSSSYREKWQSSKGRQRMVARWLAVDKRESEKVMAQYLWLTVKQWKTRGYSPKILKQQAKHAISLRNPGSKEWRFLNQILEEINREPRILEKSSK